MLKQNMTKGYLKTSQIDEGFVSLFNKPGPYYSSYPVLGEWKNIQNNNNYIKSLKLFFKNNPNKALHLYLHIPYCAKLCYYCSCRIHISNKRETINSFVMSLVAEINMLNEFLKCFIYLVDRDGFRWVERVVSDCFRKRGKGSATFHGESDMN